LRITVATTASAGDIVGCGNCHPGAYLRGWSSGEKGKAKPKRIEANSAKKEVFSKTNEKFEIETELYSKTREEKIVGRFKKSLAAPEKSSNSKI